MSFGNDAERVGGVERPASDEDPRQPVEIEARQGARFEADPDEVALGESGALEEKTVLLVGRHIFGPRGEEDERLHTSR